MKTKLKHDFMMTIRERESSSFTNRKGPWVSRGVWASDIETVWEDKQDDIIRVRLRYWDDEAAGFEQALLPTFRTVEMFNSFVNDKIKELMS